MIYEVKNYLNGYLVTPNCKNYSFQLDVCITKLLYFLSISRNLIYIDNPVGTGYSFTRNDKDYASNEIQVARHS
uniref:Uncharacterized protein n=1 Tax=Vespula pensylvanica TaxID=30213 RepID=A0A834P336_VESPE|nr:hypothetical protein H0235_006529 [Vespula pensylvanica]